MYNGIGLSSVRGTATSGHVQRNAGHVRNSSHHHRSRTAGCFDGEPSDRKRGSAHLLTAEALQDGASSLALHEKKRQLEVRLLELRDRLEERGWDDSKIENEVGRERRQTLDRWAREEEERKRLSLKGGEDGETESKSGEQNGDVSVAAQAESTRRYNDRGHGRFHQHQLHSEASMRGKGGKNAQRQLALQEERNGKLRDAFGISEKHHKEGAAFDRELIDAKRREKQLRDEQKAKAERKATREKIREEKQLAKLERREERQGKKHTSSDEKDYTHGKTTRRSRKRSESSSSSSYSSTSRNSSSSSGSYSSSSSDEKYRGPSAGKKRGRSYSSSSSSSASYSSSSYSSGRNGRSRGRDKKPYRRSSYSSHSDRAVSPQASSRPPPPDSKSKGHDFHTEPKRRQPSRSSSRSSKSSRSSSRSRSYSSSPSNVEERHMEER